MTEPNGARATVAGAGSKLDTSLSSQLDDYFAPLVTSYATWNGLSGLFFAR